MLVKSKIQLVNENIKLVQDFYESLANLTDKYIIEDSIFVYRDNKVFEATQGYFEVLKEFDNLNEAVKSCMQDFNNMGIRIMNNNKFISGKVRKNISECNNDNPIFDIDLFMNI